MQYEHYIFPLMFAVMAIYKRSAISFVALAISLAALLLISTNTVFSSDTDKIACQAFLNSLFAIGSIVTWVKNRSEFILYISYIAAIASLLSYLRLFIHFYSDDLLLYGQLQTAITELIKFGAVVVLGLIAFTPSNKDFVGYVRDIIAGHSGNDSLGHFRLHRKD
jgi:hypothetical protein